MGHVGGETEHLWGHDSVHNPRADRVDGPCKAPQLVPVRAGVKQRRPTRKLDRVKHACKLQGLPGNGRSGAGVRTVAARAAAGLRHHPRDSSQQQSHLDLGAEWGGAGQASTHGGCSVTRQMAEALATSPRLVFHRRHERRMRPHEEQDCHERDHCAHRRAQDSGGVRKHHRRPEPGMPRRRADGLEPRIRHHKEPDGNDQQALNGPCRLGGLHGVREGRAVVLALARWTARPSRGSQGPRRRPSGWPRSGLSIAAQRGPPCLKRLLARP
jgi:hypothetical protein